MTTFLALVALAAAFVCAGLLWRVTRENRRRSEARIAALATAIDGDRTPAAGGAVQPAANAALFEAGGASSMQGRPLLKVAVGFATAVTLIVGAAMIADREATRLSPPGGDAAQAAALELLSMRHARSGEQFTVTGLVRNPGPAVPVPVIAVVLAFDRRGDFITSGRAPLEFPRLEDGDESPFRVTLSSVPDVGRYRVSFRTEAGVIRHVDRREGATPLVASN